ncbi:MAG: hypothetical protein QN193_02890 [Armatimonadota bacterium]|nr:hypothetical protein [Armatimonadota bacterium]MDR7444119.1 hypothetical protein [Armatimonadota bacterium]MDR7569536.1 hypothetical protein [Armatimonadota bacterium]MDR7613568.1 hypothetical protein [Armatimonadota bacterium]
MGSLARVLGATAAALLLTAPAGAADPTDQLQKLLRARARAAYAGRQLIVTRDTGPVRTLVVRVERDPVGWTRLVYRPVGARGRFVVFQRGTTQFTYDPRRGLARRSTLPRWEAFPLEDHLAWLQENYRIRASPGRTLGRPTLRLELIPRFTDRPRARFEIDLETGVFLRSERFTPDGHLGDLTAFLTFEPRPPGWRRNLSVPRGARLIVDPVPHVVREEELAARLGVRPVTFPPPPGFHHVVDLLVPGREVMVQRVYSDGLSVLVVHQRRGSIPRPAAGSRMVQRAGGPVWVQRAGTRTVVHWSRGGWLLTATGDLAPEALLRIAEATGVDPGPRLVDHLLAWLRSLGLPI